MSFMGVSLGDMHLDKLTKYWPNANAMQTRAARLAVEHGMRQGCTRAFLLGDLAEGIRDSTGNAMRLSESGQIELLKLLVWLDNRIETDIILGNHDWAAEGSHSLGAFIEMQRQGLFKRVRIHDTLTKAKIGDTKVSFMPFPHTEPPPGTHLGFAHYEVKGAVGDNGRSSHSELEADFDCNIIQGHLHTKQKVRKHYYPGTLYQTSFGESLPKGFMMFQADGRRFKQKWVQVDPQFKLINLRVNDAADLKQLTKDDKTLYKLFVHESVTVPERLLLDYPNIVNRKSFVDEKEAEALEFEDYQSENQLIDLDHRAELPNYLKQNGATKQQIGRALEIVDSYSVR